MNRIPGLDGWRGIAILLVLADHGQYPLFGYPHIATGLHGVTLFFVLSGYLITRKLAADKISKGRVELQAFYRRRAVRIVPAAWAYLFLLLILLMAARIPVRRMDFLSSALFFGNYVDGQAVTRHFWSLAVEAQFYLAWPLLLARANLRTATAIAACGALLSAAWTVFFPHAGCSYFHTGVQLDPLLVGCLAALLESWLKPALRSWMTWPLLSILGALIVMTAMPVPFIEPAVIALLLVITSGKRTPILDSNVLRALGAVSYSLYIYQQPFFMYPANSFAAFLMHVVICVPCALLSWRYLEPKRVRRSAIHLSVYEQTFGAVEA